MSIPTQTLTAIINRGRAFFRTSFPGFPMGVKQFFGQTSRALGLNVWALQKAVEDLDNDIVPSPNNSGDALSTWAFNLGLPDGAGGYGRLKATTASGGAATLTGTLGTPYADGLVATAEDGVTQIKVSGAVSITGTPPGTGSVAAKFVAVTPGTVGNLPIGTICTWENTPSGSDLTFVLTGALSGAVDVESNAAVFGRIVAQLQNPAIGGNSTDIDDWSFTVAGILGVFIYPRRGGTGTVDVVITQGGSGVDRVPSTTLQDDVATAIDSKRVPGSETFSVLLPYTRTGHLARVRVVANGAANAFDWDDTAASYTVDTGGYSAGPPATLRLNTTAPLSLKNAIDAYKAAPTTALKPRLQVLSTGAAPNNPGIGCVDWSDGGGKTTLTLETVPSTWTAPSSGDTVYAHGPVVDTIAAGVLAYVDTLGPSRASGYGDSLNTWQDTLAINQITRIAEDAVDTSGMVLISEVLAGGATVDGAATDVQGIDDGVNAPELLFLSHVAITQ